MLRAIKDDTLILGMTRRNFDLLIDHKPLRFSLPLKHIRSVILVFGETKPDIIEEVEASGLFKFSETAKRIAREYPE